MLPLYVVLGVLVLLSAVALVLERRSTSAVTAFRNTWQTELTGLSNELRAERQTSSELRERAGRFQGQLTVLEKTAIDSGTRAAESAAKLEAAESRVTQLTREHAEAKTGLDNAIARVTEITEQLTQQSEEIRRLNDQLLMLRTQLAKAEADLQSARQFKEETTAFISDAQTRMTQTVAQLASETLGEKGRELQTQSRTELSMLLKPLSDTITAFQARNEMLYADTSSHTSHLLGALQQLTTNQQRIAEDYAAFARAMKGNPKARGDWGEMVLETALQSSGLEEGVHYVSQQSAIDDDSGQRVKPDIVINLPDNRHVIVDSKVSLLAWHDAVNCGDDDPEGYAAAIRRHVDALRTHVKELSEKNYPKALGSSALEVTIAFVPIESALAGALSADSSLLPYAFQRSVVFASPNTLMAVLVVIGRLWTRDKLTRTAKEMADTGGRILDAVAKFLSEFEAVGKRLNAVTDAYSAAKYSLQESTHSVVHRTRRLVELGAKGKSPLPEQLELDETLETGAAELILADEGPSFLPDGAASAADTNGAADVPF